MNGTASCAVIEILHRRRDIALWEPIAFWMIAKARVTIFFAAGSRLSLAHQTILHRRNLAPRPRLPKSGIGNGAPVGAS